MARTGALLLALSGAFGCKENLSSQPGGNGADTTGPTLHLSPAQDTVADSVGTLLVHVTGRDESGIKQLDFYLLPALATYGTLTPLDTSFNVFYTVQLSNYKHGTLRFYARSTDLLNHETVSDTVTVTVK